MKKTNLEFVLIMLYAFLMSCSDETAPSQIQVSEAISKVETSYYRGAEKSEGIFTGEKIETILDDFSRQKLYNDIDKEIAQSLAGLRDKYKVERTLFEGFDVGVIPNSNACPSWSEKIEIYMDCEDKNPATGWIDEPSVSIDDYRGAWSVDANKNVRMVFCRVDGRELITPGELYYAPAAVLRLGLNFTGAGVIERYFDNEDKNNKNSFSGDIAPNISNKNTTLFFADITGLGQGQHCCKPYPSFGFGYGVVSLAGTAGSQYGRLNIDDEDSGNTNRLLYNGSPAYQNKVHNYLYGGANTQIFIAKVTFQ